MNVLVVAAAGLHCHWLGPYGNPWVATPAADALAAEAVVFDRHVAADPSPAGVRGSCPAPLLSALRAAGVFTVRVDDRKAPTPDDRPWDLVIPTEPQHHPTPGAALLAGVRAALDRLSGSSSWLLWVETERLLPPWDLELETYQQYAATSGGFAAGGESDDSDPADVAPTDEPAPGPVVADDDREWHRLHNSFGAAVTAFDAELADLVREYRTRGLDESAAWIVTSAHGWPLGEHGLVGPAGSRMHEELVHVPLLVRLPRQSQGMRRVPVLTQTTDLPATIGDLFGVPVPTGRSLLPLTIGAVVNWRQTAVSAVGDERALRTPEWAFLPANPVTHQPARLYRKPDDIWEVNDLAPRHPDECDPLAALLESLREASP